jgi:hypothetical protein
MSRKRHEQSKKRARGGSSERENEEDGPSAGGNMPYDAQGSRAETEALDKEDGFKRGGKAKPKKLRKPGGRANGRRPVARADKPRRARGGRSPLSAAATVKSRPGMDDGAQVDRDSD